jgi:hypothetical protein
MKGKISFQCIEGAYVCQIVPSGAVLIDALLGAVPGFKFHKTPTSDNHFFGLKSGEFYSLRALAEEKGEISFSPIDEVSGSGFRISESTFFTAIKKIHDERVVNRAAAKQKAALAAAEAAFSKLPCEDRAKLEWQNSPDLQNEFYSLEGYVAFRRADEAGKIRICKREK